MSPQRHEIIVIEQDADELCAGGGVVCAGQGAPCGEGTGGGGELGFAGGDGEELQPRCADEGGFFGRGFCDAGGDFFRGGVDEGAVAHGERLLRDDALVAAVAVLHIGGVERGEKAVLFDVGVEEVEAAAAGVFLRGWRDGWAAECGIELAGECEQ